MRILRVWTASFFLIACGSTGVGKEGATAIERDEVFEDDPDVGTGPGGCKPKTCADSIQCGIVDNGCGQPMHCGECGEGYVCGLAEANACTEVAKCSVPEGLTDAQRAAALSIGGFRSALGLDCLEMVDAINRAAQGHADYYHLNREDTSCKSDGHRQTSTCPGFTGVNFWDRMRAEGYTGASYEIGAPGDTQEAAIRMWLGTLWHRIPLTRPQASDYGVGSSPTWQVADFGKLHDADATALAIYPGEGMTVSHVGGNENPTPPPPPDSCDSRGTYVTVQSLEATPMEIEVHELWDAQGNRLEHRWVQPGDVFNKDSENEEDPGTITPKGLYAMVPCLLAPEERYFIHLRGTRNGEPFTHWSSFTTR